MRLWNPLVPDQLAIIQQLLFFRQGKVALHLHVVVIDPEKLEGRIACWARMDKFWKWHV